MLEEGTSLADQMSLCLAKNISPARPKCCTSAAVVWPQPLLRWDPILGSGRKEGKRDVSRGPVQLSPRHRGRQPSSTTSAPRPQLFPWLPTTSSPSPSDLDLETCLLGTGQETSHPGVLPLGGRTCGLQLSLYIV